MGWIIPGGGDAAASTFVSEIDFIYYLILVITGIAFVIVEIGLLWFSCKYRARPGHKAHYTHGNATAEVIWTAVPAVVVVGIGILSAPIWNKVKGRDSIPAGALEYNVTAKQFEWNVGYPGPDGQINTADDFRVRNQLHIPVNRDIALTGQAEDVIHSFFVPEFRVKQDVVPGMHQRIWFRPTRVGQYELACAELCGLGHYKMRAFVTVHTQEEYDAWLAERAAQAQSEAQPSPVASR
jgi:cytochrome c oxidase subunit 2